VGKTKRANERAGASSDGVERKMNSHVFRSPKDHTLSRDSHARLPIRTTSSSRVHVSWCDLATFWYLAALDTLPNYVPWEWGSPPSPSESQALHEVHQRLSLPVTTSNTTLVSDMGLCLSTTSRPRSNKRIGRGTISDESQRQRCVSSCLLHLLMINGQ